MHLRGIFWNDDARSKCEGGKGDDSAHGAGNPCLARFDHGTANEALMQGEGLPDLDGNGKGAAKSFRRN
jgi:hypothetical protein